MCPICLRSSCFESFHSLEEQEQYEKAIKAYEKFLDIHREVRESLQEEAKEYKLEEGD